eukprot:TRINITY_DN15117_c2_g1_i1.p3 TRINITY_DN15117_c2_g1~~TRINITY_DN15117_c2_g1_i1.p3  ORF type:complete len:178 (+),score=65.69 TRINITY_DN15117_c2_g1_i1:586-1119(+)
MRDSAAAVATVRELIRESVLPSDRPHQTTHPTLYMAQHQLLLQVSELRPDVPLPDCVPPTATAHLFIGPRGTVTPFHTDPTRNVLCQIRGRKYVRLHAAVPVTAAEGPAREARSPREAGLGMAAALRRVEDGLEVGLPDTASGFDLCLSPGDAVFIPPGWFHYCEALTGSVSVGFWF